MNVASLASRVGATRTRGLQYDWEAVALIALAASIFQPWNATALPVLDFSEFLPPLAANDSVYSQFRAVAAYMTGQGRACVLQFVHMVLGWNAFGTSAPGWHWSYFALNTGVLLAGRRLLLRTGASRTAAFVALALWLAMEPVAATWLRPTGEPIGLLFVICAITAGLNYATATHWQRRLALIVLCLVGTIAAKELLVVLAPVVWLVTRLTYSDGQWRWARWSERDTMMLVVLFAVVTVMLSAVAYVASSAPAGNYAARYGTQTFSLDRLYLRLQSVALPSRVRIPTFAQISSDPGWRFWLMLPVAIWLAVISIGLRGTVSRGVTWCLLIALSWMMAGVVAYMPWPGPAAFYMAPFAFGLTFGAAHVLTSVFRDGESYRPAALLAVASLIVITAVEARDQVHEHEIRVGLDSAVLAAIGESRATSLITAVPSPVRPGGWGWAEKLAAFGNVSPGHLVGKAADTSCEGARALFLSGQSTALIVSAQEGCGKLSPRSAVVSVAAPRYRWPMLFSPQINRRTVFIVDGLRPGS